MNINETKLPTKISVFEAVEIAYPAELSNCYNALQRKLPVMVECDKELVPYFYKCLRDRLKQSDISCVYLDGRPDPNAPPDLMPQGMIGTMISQLRDEVRAAVDLKKVIVLPHLDLLTTTNGGLTAEAREVIPLMYENPNILWVGFKDPSFGLPKVIEELFPYHISILGIPRERLEYLITQKESRKFSENFNLYQLYKYVSGLNAVRLRRLLSSLNGEDYPQNNQPVINQMRIGTISSEISIPDLDMEKDIGGYKKVKERLSNEILSLLARKDKMNDQASIIKIEALVPRGMLFTGPPGCGKCLGHGTPVIKYDGTICPVEDIKAGDFLMGPDSLAREVFSTTVGVGPMYKIQPKIGDSWICNEPHILTLVHSETNEIIDIPLDEYLNLPENKKVCLELFSVAIDFPETNEEFLIDPYSFGTMLGYNFELETEGIKMEVPRKYLVASRHDRENFLAGFIDTVGIINLSHIEITEVRQKELKSITFIARSLGLKVIETQEDNFFYKLSLFGDFSNIPIKTKGKILQKKNPLRVGFDVIPVGKGNYYGFTIDRDGRFLLGDFTVTHNTIFAKAMATALGATVTVVNGPELKNKWVGESERRIRQIFLKARQSAPSIIIFDELDSFATARGTYASSGVEHSMVNQLLTEMDGFRQNEMVFVVGTTNFVESIDPALRRPGRFEFHLNIPYPDKDARESIFSIYNKKFDLKMNDQAMDFAVKRSAYPVEATNTRYSGDHIQALCRTIARNRIRHDLDGITTSDDVESAITVYQEKADLKPEEEKRIAIHESGHAICALHCKDAPPIERISIKGDLAGALGFVSYAEPNHKHVISRNQLTAAICSLYGGREAESLLCDDVSIGSVSDLSRATQIARSLVEQYGFGPDSLGLRIFQEKRGIPTLSEKAKEKLEAQICEVLDIERKRAQKILKENKKQLEALTQLLIERKVLDSSTLKEELNF